MATTVGRAEGREATDNTGTQNLIGTNGVTLSTPGCFADWAGGESWFGNAK